MVANKASEVSASTYDKYKNMADSAGPFFEALGVDCLASLTVDHVTALRNHWAKANFTGTANHKLKVLRIALNDAWREHYVTENVAKKVQALRETAADKQRTKRRDFTPAELTAILKAADTVWRVMSLLGLFTGGQRMGDLACLRKRDVDLKKLEINSVAQKTGAAIILPIVPELEKALRALPLPPKPDDYLFPTLATKSKAARSLAFGRVLYKAGLAPRPVKTRIAKDGPRATTRKTNELGFHSFRHTATSMLKAAGVGESVAMAIAGHESKAISQNYTHIGACRRSDPRSPFVIRKFLIRHLPMIPEPSRQPFRPPIPEAALHYFCSPAAGTEFGAPVHHGDLVYAANGYVALRVRSFYGFPADYAPASPAYLERWNKLHWKFLDPLDPKFTRRPFLSRTCPGKAMMLSRSATSRQCTWPGSRCWISPEAHFRPQPDAPDLTPGIVVADGDRGDFWVRIPHRCILVDRRVLVFSEEYLTRRGRWIPESSSRVRPYLLFKLNEAPASLLEKDRHGQFSLAM